MTLTLEVSPEVERALVAKARMRGLQVQEYARVVLEHDAQLPDDSGNDTDDFDIDLETLLINQSDERVLAGLGPLPDDAVGDAYFEREASQL